MTELDETKNPFGIIPSNPGQWVEARGFTRVYGKNPFAQARLLETLVGLYKIPAEGWSPSGIVSEEQKEEAKKAIATVIAYLGIEFPEWQEDHEQPEVDAYSEAPYQASELLCRQVADILCEHPEFATWTD